MEGDSSSESSSSEDQIDQDLVASEKQKVKKKQKIVNPGVIYLSSVPDFMSVQKLRNVFSEYGEINRTFFQPVVLSQCKPQGLGAERAGVTEEKIQELFRQAGEAITAVAPDLLQQPSRTFNADETGFPLCVQTGAVIAPKHDKFVYQITNDQRTQLTVLACGATDETILKPTIIFPGSRFRYGPLEGFEKAHFARSANGWIDSEVFETWLETVFIPSTSELDKPVLLLADGHKTHLTLKVHTLCVINNIMYAFVPHASHIQQPLYQMSLKCLKLAWRKRVHAFQEKFHRTVGKPNFARVLKEAWEEGMTSDALKRAFKVTGFYPWSPDSCNYTKCRPSALYMSPDQTGHMTDIPPANPLPDNDKDSEEDTTFPDCPTPTVSDTASSLQPPPPPMPPVISPEPSGLPSSTLPLLRQEAIKSALNELTDLSAFLGSDKVKHFQKCIDPF